MIMDFSDDGIKGIRKFLCRHAWQQELTAKREYRVICLKCESMYRCRKCGSIDASKGSFSWECVICRTCRARDFDEKEEKKRRLLGS